MKAKILIVDDDPEICETAKSFFNGEVISGKTITVETTTNFSTAKDILRDGSFDIVVLDLKGSGRDQDGLELGESVLNEIKKTCFVSVIFNTCFPVSVLTHESHMIKIVSKGETLEALQIEIAKMLSSKIADIKNKLDLYIKESMRSYMWDFVHDHWASLSGIIDEKMLNHLLARRLAHTLTKEKIVALMGEDSYNPEIAHPIEEYIYPPLSIEYRTGDLLKKNEKFYILITPSCDMILRKGVRKAEDITLIECLPLTESKEYKEYKDVKTANLLEKINDKRGKLKNFVENRLSERFFFLPGTHFIEDSFVDFQKLLTVKYSELTVFVKVAELDTAYADSLLVQFVRYFNRIGTRDLNSDFVMQRIESLL